MAGQKGAIVVVGGIKGGVAKTTTALNLAVMYARAGLDVKLVDMDGSKGSLEWAALREEMGIEPVITSESMHGVKYAWKKLDALSEKHDIIICDGGGYDSQEFRDSLQVANVLITPTRPNQVDFNTIPKVDLIIEKTKDLNERGLQCFLYLTQVPSDSYRQIAKAQANLNTFLGDAFPNYGILDNVSTFRNTYPISHTNGRGIVEFARKTETALKEMNNLFEELANG